MRLIAKDGYNAVINNRKDIDKDPSRTRYVFAALAGFFSGKCLATFGLLNTKNQMRRSICGRCSGFWC